MRMKTNSSIPISNAVLPRHTWGVGLVWLVMLATAPVWTGCSRNDGAADGPVKIRAEGHNVILITMDTTRTDFLGCYGAPNASTPNLDRLAKEGVRLTRCSTCVSLTLPSHASMLTGYYPFVHGLRNNGTRRLADSFDTLPEILKRAGYATGAEIASAVLDARYGLDQGFDTYHDVETNGQGRVYPQRRGDDICNAAIEQLQTLAAGRFFLWVHFYDPHDPYDAPGYVGPPGRPAYAAEVAFMDTQIGRLIDELKRLGIEKKTLVALISDHGEGLGDHGEGGHGYFVYETTVHVPFILWCPGTIPAGRKIDAITRTVDAFPTLLELVGLSGPESVHGASLVSLLKGEETSLAATAYAESLAGHLRFGLSPLRCLRAEQRKYTLAPNAALHDLEVDPNEIRNVIREFPAIADGLHEQLKRLVDDAPPPPSDADAAVQMSDADRQSLVAMGYAGAASGENIEAESSIFEPKGPDPRSHIEDINLDNAAMTAYSEGDFATAEPMMHRIVAAFPEAPMVRIDMANLLSGMNRLSEACDHLAKAVELDPKADDLRRMYAEYLIRAERLDDADTQLTILMERKKDDPLILRNLGLLRVEQDRLEEANEYFEKAAALDPDDAKPIRGRALVLCREGKYKEAEALLKKALESDTQNALLITDLAFALEKQNLVEEAVVEYRRAVDCDPTAAEPREQLARLLGEQERWAEALEQYNLLVEQAPQNSERLAQRAHALTRLNRQAEAEADFRKARILNPNDLLLLRGLVLTLVDIGKPNEAVAQLQLALADGADEPIVLGLLAYATQQMGDLTEADKLYEQALAKDPEHAAIRTWHAGLLLLQKREEEAATEFARALQINADDVEARLGLGQIAAQRGDFDNAHAQFERILQREPKNIRALHALGILHARQKNWDEAARLFREVLAINPNHQRAKQDLERVRQRRQESASP
ncbi:MAG: sulfatase-like hydrolase/transferase [Phycisphaerae bacterium]|nr:sulfatase-like hydrolase/transferase [Phycisphaerae bacterium]